MPQGKRHYNMKNKLMFGPFGGFAVSRPSWQAVSIRARALHAADIISRGEFIAALRGAGAPLIAPYNRHGWHRAMRAAVSCARAAEHAAAQRRGRERAGGMRAARVAAAAARVAHVRTLAAADERKALPPNMGPAFWSACPRKARGARAAGVYRRALAMAGGSASLWMLRNCAKFAMPARDVDDAGARYRRAAIVEHADGAGDDVGAGWHAAAEVGAEYRLAFLTEAARLLRVWRALFAHLRHRPATVVLTPRMRQDSVARGWDARPRAWLFEAWRKRTFRRAAHAAAVSVYGVGGRDGREVGAGWHCVGAIDSPLSSDPVTLAAGGWGKRAGVMPQVWRAVARIRSAAREVIAAAAGKGALAESNACRRAIALCATAAAIEAAAEWQLPPATAAALSSGAEGGMPAAWRMRAMRARRAAGIKAERAARTTGDAVVSWGSGRAPHVGDPREDSPNPADWQAWEAALRALRPE